MKVFLDLFHHNIVCQWIIYILEAGTIFSIFWILRILPTGVSSSLCGLFLDFLSSYLQITVTTRHNLFIAFPNYPLPYIKEMVGRIWNNLGYTIGEFPHIATIVNGSEQVEINGHNIISSLQEEKSPGIFFSAHIGNWELATLLGLQRRLALSVFYRIPNNWLVARLYYRVHGAGRIHLLPKGSQGARQGLIALRSGLSLGILVDQKMNDGIAIPFFSQDTMTAPAVAQFAYRYKCPVIPSRIIRINSVNFRLVIEPPLILPTMNNYFMNTVETMRYINTYTEAWIRETPEQWLWLHHRWPMQNRFIPLVNHK